MFKCWKTSLDTYWMSPSLLTFSLFGTVGNGELQMLIMNLKGHKHFESSTLGKKVPNQFDTGPTPKGSSVKDSMEKGLQEFQLVIACAVSSPWPQYAPINQLHRNSSKNNSITLFYFWSYASPRFLCLSFPSTWHP